MKKIVLLPSLFTTGNLFCGVCAVICALNDKVVMGAWLILAAMFFDFLDGQAARLKNVTTRFGVEYDSLADLVSFGFAPALMVYMKFLKGMGRMEIVLFFIYIACTALRLARFNTQKISQQKLSFLGLPTPGSSGFIASIIILNNKYPFRFLIYIMPVLMLILSALMVSTFRYPALGIINLWKKKPFLNLVVIILCGAMVFLQTEWFLFLCFFGYVLTGITGWKGYAEPVTSKTTSERSGYETV